MHMPVLKVGSCSDHGIIILYGSGASCALKASFVSLNTHEVFIFLRPQLNFQMMVLSMRGWNCIVNYFVEVGCPISTFMLIYTSWMNNIDIFEWLMVRKYV